MKKTLSLLLTLMLLAVPALSAFADFGWEDGLFFLYDANLALAVPEGAVAAGEAELDALNAANPSSPQVIFMAHNPATGISCATALKTLDDPELIAGFVVEYINNMAAEFDIDPSAITREVIPFFSGESLLFTCTYNASGVDIECISYLFDVGPNIYMIAIAAPEIHNDAFDPFLAQLFAPMYEE